MHFLLFHYHFLIASHVFLVFNLDGKKYVSDIIMMRFMQSLMLTHQAYAACAGMHGACALSKIGSSK